jgi:hypothetical protein
MKILVIMKHITGPHTMLAIKFIAFLAFLLAPQSWAQFQRGTPLFKQAVKQQSANLYETVTTNPDVNLYFNPQNAYIYTNNYIFDYPNPEQYRISLLIDPCRFTGRPDCCMNVFGSPEYPKLKISPWEAERNFKPPFFGSDTEVQINFNLVDELGFGIDSTMKRYADDVEYYNEDCLGYLKPFRYCAGKNYAYRRSDERAACIDNNYTLNTLSDCYYPNGTKSQRCFQVGYSQDAFIPVCKDESDPHCGTFLEVHISNGNRIVIRVAFVYLYFYKLYMNNSSTSSY